jgi:hypothetical protein
MVSMRSIETIYFIGAGENRKTELAPI